VISLWARGPKRLFDLGLSGTGLLLFSLPMLWIARRVRKTRGAVLFRQPRIGYGGKPFVILKFKTMSEHQPPDRFGQWLRATALDELPQLINIFRGDMSFVGPRPLVSSELQGLDRAPEWKRRQSARPGLTGLAQLYGDKSPSLPERLRWDLDYLRDCSFLLDIRILAASIRITLEGRWEKAGPKVSAGEV